MAKKTTKKTDEKELRETLQRLQAEFENYKKRTAKEQEQFRKRAGEGVLRELLPIIDNFSLALKNNEQENEFTKGVELIYAQLAELLENHNVHKINAEGTTFNPTLHEALMTKNDDTKEHNSILEVMQDGYTLHDKILRPAKVIVNKKEN